MKYHTRKKNSPCFEMKFVRHEIYLNTQHIKNMASTVQIKYSVMSV